MTSLTLASGLAILTAMAHSYLSERLVLRPLRREAVEGSVLSFEVAKRLAAAMFHLASLCWVGMAVSLLLLDSDAGGYRGTLLIFAGIYAVSGIGNFWAVRRPHPGGIMLLSTSALILGTLYF